MEKKKIEDLTVQMTIDEDVYSAKKELLIAKGTAVNGEILYLLHSHGIKEVAATSPVEEKNIPADNPQQIQDIERRVEGKFREFREDEQMQYLACLAKDYLKLKATKKKRENRGTT
ncbi:MAG: hypothetical protein JXD21_00900 [Candidatus Omnitrophica bacterium]|nr:hypothetical protein [Candidatus Omnitrophota bacterium]